MTLLALLCGLGSLVNDNVIFMWVYFWILYSVLLISLSILSPRAHSLGYCSLIEVLCWVVSVLQHGSSLSIVLAILGLFPLHVNFTISLSRSTIELAGILTGIALNLWNKLGRTDTLTIMSLLIQEHELFLHLSSSSSITTI